MTDVTDRGRDRLLFQWSPIRSAPRNGHVVIGARWDAEGFNPRLVWVSSIRWWTPAEFAAAYGGVHATYQGGWQLAPEPGEDEVIPTHWMHVPLEGVKP